MSSLPQLGRALPLGSRVIVVGRRLLGSDPSGRRAWAFNEIGKWSWSNEATGQSASAFAYERVHPGQAQAPRGGRVLGETKRNEILDRSGPACAHVSALHLAAGRAGESDTLSKLVTS